jgi:hypothetical protein
MTIREASDLGKKVERYEIALDELRIAHQDVKGVLVEALLIERLQQLGEELGYSVAPQETSQDQRDLASLNHGLPEMSESWSG